MTRSIRMPAPIMIAAEMAIAAANPKLSPAASDTVQAI
ncbi:hypothetical protein ACVIHF_008672 [Bradyrhizobium sp. USDA 4506]